MNVKPLRIAYISELSPASKHSWSGSVHYIFEALKKQGYTVTALGPAKPKMAYYVCMVLNQVSLRIFRKRFDYRHSRLYARAFGKLFTRKLNQTEHDIIVVCGGTEYAAYLQTSKPVYIIVDRTIAGAINYHSILSDLWGFSKEQSIFTDKKAMLAAKAVFFASAWAADNARKHYGLPEAKAIVQPFGANLDLIPSADLIYKRLDSTTCKLFFLGVNWENKGGPVAYDCLLALLNNNIDAELTVCGCVPPESFRHERLHVIPFLNKNDERDYAKLRQLFTESSFLILPTRFEAYGLVFCEAAAYGLPSLGTDTGGVGSALMNEHSGYLMPADATGQEYATKIAAVFQQREVYKQLITEARRTFDSQLNWDAWGKGFTNVVENTA